MTSSGSAVAATLSAAATARPDEPPTSRPSSRGESPRHRERVGVADRDHLIGDVPVEGGRPDVLAHALHQVRAAGPAGVDAPLRVRADDLDPVAVGRFLEEAAGAGDRAAGADARDEVGDLPVGLPPDLRAGPVIMRGRVVRVRVLVRAASAFGVVSLARRRATL